MVIIFLSCWFFLQITARRVYETTCMCSIHFLRNLKILGKENYWNKVVNIDYVGLSNILEGITMLTRLKISGPTHSSLNLNK